MGGSLTKRVEAQLQSSELFQAAIAASFNECAALAHQQASSIIYAYQLLDASRRIYNLIPADQPQDPASLLKDKWLPSPPTQAHVDCTVRHLGLFRSDSQQALGLDEFRAFASALFRDIALTTAERKLALYVPIGTLGMLSVHLALRRLPFVGPFYKSAGVVIPGMLLGSVLGALTALGFDLP